MIPVCSSVGNTAAARVPGGQQWQKTLNGVLVILKWDVKGGAHMYDALVILQEDGHRSMMYW